MLFWMMLVAEESGSWLVMRRYGQGSERRWRRREATM